jgi:hypothetical protein
MSRSIGPYLSDGNQYSPNSRFSSNPYSPITSQFSLFFLFILFIGKRMKGEDETGAPSGQPKRHLCLFTTFFKNFCPIRGHGGHRKMEAPGDKGSWMGGRAGPGGAPQHRRERMDKEEESFHSVKDKSAIPLQKVDSPSLLDKES